VVLVAGGPGGGWSWWRVALVAGGPGGGWPWWRVALVAGGPLYKGPGVSR
jgi:hypothetical protein